MKGNNFKYLFVLAFTFLFFAGCDSKNPVKPDPVKEEKDIPKIEISEYSHDFGEVPATTPSEGWSLMVRNTGKGFLTVKDLVFDQDLFKISVDPPFSVSSMGNGEYIVITFTPKEERLYEETMTILSECKKDSSITLTLKGKGAKKPPGWYSRPNVDKYKNSSINAVKQISGGYVLGGNTSTESYTSEWLMGVDEKGKRNWLKKPPDSDVSQFKGMDLADGGLLATGVNYAGYGVKSYIWVSKYSLAGEKIWYDRVDSPEASSPSSIESTSDGGFILLGYFFSGSNTIFLAKMDGSGNEEWRSELQQGSSLRRASRDVIQSPDGGYAVLGNIDSLSSKRDFMVIKVDPDGKEEWMRVFGGLKDDDPHEIEKAADGGYVIVGETKSFGAGGMDGWVLKIDAYGNEEWSRTFGGPNEDYLRDIKVTNDGGYILVGGTESSGAGGVDVWLIKTDPSGNEEWSRTFGDEYDDIGFSVEQTYDGGYIIGGTYGVPKDDEYKKNENWLIKTDENGNAE